MRQAGTMAEGGRSRDDGIGVRCLASDRSRERHGWAGRRRLEKGGGEPSSDAACLAAAALGAAAAAAAADVTATERAVAC
jgi:hypothetical protein